MLKKHERLFGYLQKISDCLIAIGLWLFVYFIRFSLFPNAQSGLGLNFLRAGFVMGIFTVFTFHRFGLYKSYRLRSLYEELTTVFKANCIANLLVVALLYLFFEERLSRAVLIGYFAISSVSFLIFRMLLRGILRNLRRKGMNLRHIVLVGNGPALETYLQNLNSYDEAGVKVKGWIDSNGLASKHGIKDLKFDCLFGPGKIIPDGIVIGYGGPDGAKIDNILKKVYNDVVPIVVLPDLTYSVVGHRIDHLAGVPAFIINEPKFSSSEVLLKRTFDIVMSFCGLVILLPLFGVIAVLVKLTSPGPIFYGQERIGLDGEKFKMWKFRSMRMDVKTGGDSACPGWTVSGDPRRTKFGIFLRTSSLDELPQLWNVFVGNMSLVGPRPEQPYFVEKFRNEIPAYMLRHKVKAGITGWAQVNGWRGDTSLHKRIECDLYYIRNWSLWLDIEILFKTLWRISRDKNAY